MLFSDRSAKDSINSFRLLPLAPVVQTIDNAFRRINHSATNLRPPMDIDLSILRPQSASKPSLRSASFTDRFCRTYKGKAANQEHAISDSTRNFELPKPRAMNALY